MEQHGYARILTVRLPGEPLVKVPGGLFDAEQHHASAFVRDGWRDHRQLISLAETDFFDRHPIGVSEKLRADFAQSFYLTLAERPADFGDDILDGMQGVFHVAQNAKWLLPSPLSKDIGFTDVPAIAIGSGPSLSRHIPALRALQNKCLLIASNSALDGLMDAGITPHFATPMERDDIAVKLCKRESYPGVIFAGKGVVSPDITRRFNRHLFCPCTDILYTWAEAPQDALRFYGMSTGVMAVTLACQITTGPVYLAGHDLAYESGKSHWANASAVAPDTVEMEIEGHSGPVRSNAFWNRIRGQLEFQAVQHGNVINLNTLDGIGAKVRHTLAGSLPQAADLPDLVFPPWPADDDTRINAFRAKLHRLPSDARGMLTKLSTLRPTVQDVSMENLCPGPNGEIMAYLLRSLYGQFSYETFTGRPISVVAKATADALRNVISQLMPMFEEMSRAADD